MGEPGRQRANGRAAPAGRDGNDGARLGEVLEFMRLLWAIDHGLSSASKRMDATVGVTGPQRLVIRIVGRFPGISAGDVAGLMHIHPSTLTGVLSRLERRGMLKRKVDPADGRRALFSLTERGRVLDALRSGTIEAKVRAVLGKLPEGRLEATREVLEALAAALSPDREVRARPR